MAYFDADELADCVRNAFAQEDSTGLSCKVLEKPRRRVESGGLSLNFSTYVEDSDSDDELQYSPCFLPVLNEYEFCKESTSASVSANLTSRLSAIEDERVFNCAEQRPPARSLLSENYFVKKAPTAELQTTSSMVSRLVANTPIGTNCGFEEYAKFEAINETNGARKMTIVFPFCKPLSCAILISIISSATLSDLIGLSCYVYTRENRLPPCDNPLSYSLYLAEENLEYDTELPPQDRHRLVLECGFPVLALVKNSDVLQNQRFLVNVYFVNGKCSTFELETLDIPLKWIFDQALQRRKQESSDIQKRRNFAFKEFEYVLETIEQRGFPLKLTNTVSSTGCTDFVFLRKNSSRGEFFDTNIGTKFLSSSNSALILNKPNIKLQLRSSFQQYDMPSSTMNLSVSSGVIMRKLAYEHKHENNSTINVTDDVNKKNIWGDIIEEYLVDRLHKIKSKWSARFLIRKNGLEVLPVQSAEKRKSFVPQAVQKISQIFWELIGSVEVNPTERANARRIIRIVYLLVPDIYHYLFIEQNSNLDVKNQDYLIKAYELSSWKILQVEVGNKEAWKIGVKLTEILDDKRSHVRRVYDHSAYATKRPLLAIETALNLISSSQTFSLSRKSSTMLTPTFSKPCIMTTKFKINTKKGGEPSCSNNFNSTSPSSETRPKVDLRKISMIFSRMLSRQD